MFDKIANKSPHTGAHQGQGISYSERTVTVIHQILGHGRSSIDGENYFDLSITSDATQSNNTVDNFV